ncbi:hypothetical protein DH2020_015182 [Rehmannia glutinosa]|uniref:PPM-type phosphatase domain-containing protein n=1 Tax=Rehmannia glutinosa TaxID=99300 RepID=A0ABR0X1R2_REHGL
MGACCSCHRGGNFQGNFFVEEEKAQEREVEDENIILRGDKGALVRLQGSSKYVSMFTQQGRKGINQDAMTVWENFSGDRDMFLCAVFDGHGPSGHKVARYIRDILPAKISLFKRSGVEEKGDVVDIDNENDHDANENPENKNPVFLAWKARLIKCFEEMDEELEADASIESYCSGTTSVTLLKKIWDVLSNNEVVKIVASARKRSMAAKLLIDEAVRAWRYKFPCAKIDDCAVICLFFKRQRPLLTKSISEVTHLSLNYSELAAHSYAGSAKSDDGLDTVLNWGVSRSSEGAENGGDKLDTSVNRMRKRRMTTKLEPVKE